MERSVIIIQSKAPFREWLSDVCKTYPPRITPDVLYPPEDESVWLIPSRGSFANSNAFDEYIAELKPLLLASEVRRILFNISDFKGRIDASQFDDFFEIRIRAYVAEVDALYTWKPILATIEEDRRQHDGQKG